MSFGALSGLMVWDREGWLHAGGGRISTPAAAGKSVLAQAIAHRLGSFVWGVGAFAVGRGTFLGKLAESHGANRLGAVLDCITAGDYCIVIDALDERSTRALRQLQEFLRDVASQLAKAPAVRPAVIAQRNCDASHRR